MVTLYCRIDRKNNNTPILSNKEIDQFVHAVLEDYKPALLQEPSKINFEHFLESYLGATVLYYDIFHEEDKPPILGVTAFKDGYLKIFDRESLCVCTIPISANTVVIDRSLVENGETGRAMFTGLHEGGHLMMHSGVYNPDLDGQISFIEDELCSVLSCRRDSIAEFIPNPWGTRTRTPAEWREYHANYFAAAIAMPNATFRPFVQCLLRQHGFRKGQIVTGRDEDLDYLAEVLLPEEISEVYGVSKQAAFIKLKQAGFVMDKKAHAEKEAQLVF